MTNETSKILTLVFTDLADSTALKREKGDDAADALITRHRDHVVRLAGDCSGRVIDWAGDGCFLTFETSSAAVMFGLRLQEAHSEETDLPGVRVGVHMGEVTEKIGHDGLTQIKGLAVDIAARVQSLAKPGQVLLSAAVYDSARQRIGVDALGQPVLWQTHGAYTLKGFDKPLDIGEAGFEGLSPLEAPEASEKAQPLVPVSAPDIETADVEVMPDIHSNRARRYAVIAMFFAAIIGVTLGTDYLARLMMSDDAAVPGAQEGPITSLAVLPLDNLMNDPDQDYFADGMTEAITAELAKIKSLKVISRTSAQRYRDSTLSLPQIAADLKVDGLIEGSVLRVGDDVRITIQLVDARTDAHLLAKSYENTVTSVLKLQSDVALAIADSIRAELTADERERIAVAQEVNPEAYDVYLQAIDAMTDITPIGMFRVLQLFTQAAALDGEFAQAWGGVAVANTLLGAYAVGPPRTFFDAAQDAAERALELDPTIGEAEAVLGLNHVYLELDWEAAENRFATAERLNPNSFFVLYLAGVYEMMVGDWLAAQERADRILELNPYGSFPASSAAIILLSTGRVQQGIQILEGELAKNDKNVQASLYLGWGRVAEGDFEAAVKEFNRARSIAGPIPSVASLIAFAQALTGDQEEARAELDRLANSVPPEVLAISGFPWAYFALGEPDTAFEWLERAADQPAGVYLSSVRNLPPSPEWQRSETLAGVVGDPRYWRLIEWLGFPPLPREHPGYSHERAWLEKKAAAEAANAPIEKLAVLPFDNMSSDPEQVYFVDGMTEALIAELAKVKSIKVISRTSVMQYKDTDKSMPEIARELGVDALIEGSVMKAQNDVRITAQLVHGITDEHLWAKSYTNALENVFKLQAEVALAITDEINAAVTPDERARIAVVESTNPEAYELYVRGRDLWSLRTEEGLQQARRLFERALELDGDFALAHVGLADSYMILFEYGYHARDDASRNAREQIDQALAIDPELGEAYTSLGMFQLEFDWNPKEAEESYQRGIELSPGHATGHQWYAGLLATQSRHEEQLPQAQAAYELDPASPIVGIQFAEALACVGRYDEALKIAEGLRTLHPGLPRIREGLFTILTLAGRFEDALTYYESPMASEDDASQYYPGKAYLLAVTGKDSEARQILNDYIERVDPERAALPEIAAVYAALGDRDEALSWIERGYDIRHSLTRQILWYPGLRPLYEEPRFQAVLQKMNLPDPRDVN